MQEEAEGRAAHTKHHTAKGQHKRGHCKGREPSFMGRAGWLDARELAPPTADD